ncbi:MAG: membrane protein insertase YidC [Deltaproteobacteria bacterium]|nr:membrane protein insertase YidC [Deltaproteobacteria bacterium]
MDKRVILAVVLSLIVLFFYPYFLTKFYPQQAAPVKTEAPQAGAPTALAPEAGKPVVPAVPEIKEQFITVETPLFKAMFSNAGGGVKSWELKKYKEAIEEKSPLVNAAEKVARMNSFKTQVTSNGVMETVIFQPSATNIVISENQTAELVLTGTTKTGLVVEKKYKFSADSYQFDTNVRIINQSAGSIEGKAETIVTASIAGKDATGYHQGPIIYTKKKLIRQDADEAQMSDTNKLKWVGLEDKYFLAAMIPPKDSNLGWLTEVISGSTSKASLQMPVNLAAGTQAVYSYSSFLGPKEYDRLVQQRIGLEDAIEFGWFDFIARPFLVVLNFFTKYMKNYGIAIIVLTVLIKILFYPLTKKSLTSMKEMQKMQPQLAAIKERYKNDKEKMNKELMDLYKRYKINPLGGCLPMVLQIPVFIGLYEVLYVAIELRHAPFYLWIHDLAAKDPYYITPLLMGATMFLQQKMTPSSMDPSQAKIMLFMPIIFTFMFLNFPAGLVLYWLVNNILSVAQQYYIYKAPAKA